MEPDDLPRPKHVHVLGENLETVGLEELQLRVTALEDEIKRIQSEIQRKRASKSAADAFFKS
jgi:uncharacterized small protein (DUF1192 family)